jgi:galactarate dehydratase
MGDASKENGVINVHLRKGAVRRSGVSVSNWIPGRVVPVRIPGDDLTHEDMARVTGDDWADLQRIARGYCRTVDATRNRKRMDGSATVIKHGWAPYGTDDVSDDVVQDAVLIFARRLRKIIETCPIASMWLDTREIASWLYTRKDGETINIDRRSLHWWAVRDAAEHNGCRLDVSPDEIMETPGARIMHGLPHAEKLTSIAVASGVSQLSEAIMRTAWGDGSEFPTLGRLLFVAGNAENLKHDGVLATVAQAEHGGVRGSRRIVTRTRATAEREWRKLSARLDDARDELIYQSTHTSNDVD